MSELLLASPECVGGIFALGQVAGDFRKAHQLARLGADRVNDYVCPEARATFPNSPTFDLESAFALRCFQRALRQSRFLVLFGIEDGEVLSDDFMGLIALESRRPAIPARDNSLRAEHVDGVVAYCLHEQTKASVLAQGLIKAMGLWIFPHHRPSFPMDQQPSLEK